MNEAAEQNWSTRALDRQINSLYYEREREMVVREQLERYGVEITMNTGKDQSLGFLQKT
jgi:predicted nuclease of restriction endonuclease-like (RecB) superfamily